MERVQRSISFPSRLFSLLTLNEGVGGMMMVGNMRLVERGEELLQVETMMGGRNQRHPSLLSLPPSYLFKQSQEPILFSSFTKKQCVLGRGGERFRSCKQKAQNTNLKVRLFFLLRGDSPRMKVMICFADAFNSFSVNGGPRFLISLVFIPIHHPPRRCGNDEKQSSEQTR